MSNWTKLSEPFLGCDSDYASASTVIFGAPFDGTTSYRPGTRFASRTMRAESYSLETYSPYQNRDLTDYAIFDGGDLELPFGRPEKMLDLIEAQTDQILQDGRQPLMIGGEHLVTLGAVRAAARHWPDLHLIQLDAHADLRDHYLDEPLSHATVIRRCWDLLGDGRIHQFGIRSGEREEISWGRSHVATRFFNLDGLDALAAQLADVPVYLTIDLDVLDPSIFPGTGTPEAGGIMFQELVQGLLALRPLNLVAADLNELSPPLDSSGISTATALKTLRELLLVMQK